MSIRLCSRPNRSVFKCSYSHFTHKNYCFIKHKEDGEGGVWKRVHLLQSQWEYKHFYFTPIFREVMVLTGFAAHSASVCCCVALTPQKTTVRVEINKYTKKLSLPSAAGCRCASWSARCSKRSASLWRWPGPTTSAWRTVYPTSPSTTWGWWSVCRSRRCSTGSASTASSSAR